jgi:hypothetical protein
MKCNKNDCTNAATNSVSLELRVHPNYKPASTSPLLYLCAEHTIEVTWDNVVDDEGFENLCVTFEKNGYKRPLKKYSNLVIEPLKPNEFPNYNSSL